MIYLINNDMNMFGMNHFSDWFEYLGIKKVNKPFQSNTIDETKDINPKDTIIIDGIFGTLIMSYQKYERVILIVHDIFPLTNPEMYNYKWVTEEQKFKDLINENLKQDKRRLFIFNSEYTLKEFENYFKIKVFNPLILYSPVDFIYDLNLNKEYDLLIDEDYDKRKNPEASKRILNSNKFKIIYLPDFNRKLTDKDVNIYYNKTKAVYFPSYYEGLGLPIIQATKLGIPVFVNKDAKYWQEIPALKELHNLIPIDCDDYETIEKVINNWSDEDKKITISQYFKYFSYEVLKEKFLNWLNSLDNKFILYINSGLDKVNKRTYRSHNFYYDLENYIKNNNLNNYHLINIKTEDFIFDKQYFLKLKEYWTKGDIIAFEDDKNITMEDFKKLINYLDNDFYGFYYNHLNDIDDSILFNFKNGVSYVDFISPGLMMIRRSAQLKADIKEISNNIYLYNDVRLCNLFKRHNINPSIIGILKHYHPNENEIIFTNQEILNYANQDKEDLNTEERLKKLPLFNYKKVNTYQQPKQSPSVLF